MSDPHLSKPASWFALGALAGVLACGLALSGVVRSLRSGAAGAPGAPAPVVLRLGHVLDPSHPVHGGMQFMADRLAELSGGRVVMRIFPNGQLGSEPECLEQVQRGALAMTKTSAAAMEGFVPAMAVFGLPYLFRDEDHYWRVLESPIGEELLAAGAERGLHGLCYYDSGARSFYTVGKPIRVPADVAGRKIRVLPSRSAMDLISALGGAPTPIPWGELYTALQQGMVDGAENNAPSLLTSRHYEVARFYTLDEHTRVPDLLVMSEAVWSRLSEEERGWVRQAARESVPFQRRLWAEQVEAAMLKLKAEGVEVYVPDKAAFAAAVEPLLRAAEGTPAGELARRIREVP